MKIVSSSDVKILRSVSRIMRLLFGVSPPRNAVLIATHLAVDEYGVVYAMCHEYPKALYCVGDPSWIYLIWRKRGAGKRLLLPRSYEKYGERKIKFVVGKPSLLKRGRLCGNGYPELASESP